MDLKGNRFEAEEDIKTNATAERGRNIRRFFQNVKSGATSAGVLVKPTLRERKTMFTYMMVIRVHDKIPANF